MPGLPVRRPLTELAALATLIIALLVIVWSAYGTWTEGPAWWL